jgi:hypothetical protein
VTKPRTTFQRFHAALARLIRPYRWDFSRGLLATAASNGLAVRIPLTFREGIDIIVRHGTSASLLFYGLAVIQAGIQQVLAHRTALVIAHRLSTIREMDRILVLDRGGLREAGTHAQLLAAGGLYAKLYSLQFTADATREPSPPLGPASFDHTSLDRLSRAPSLAPRL